MTNSLTSRCSLFVALFSVNERTPMARRSFILAPRYVVFFFTVSFFALGVKSQELPEAKASAIPKSDQPHLSFTGFRLGMRDKELD